MGDSTPRSIGLPMLIVIFMSLCLVSFAGIAYSTARSSFEKSEGVVKRTKDYYEACNEAEILLSSLEEIPGSETTYTFPFGTNMEELQVTICPDADGKSYEITGWIISDSSSWEAPENNGNNGGGPVGPQAPK